MFEKTKFKHKTDFISSGTQYNDRTFVIKWFNSLFKLWLWKHDSKNYIFCILKLLLTNFFCFVDFFFKMGCELTLGYFIFLKKVVILNKINWEN
jgi:hypothetical protein